MNRGGIVGFLKVNQSLTRDGGEMRQFDLPRMSQFPKFDASRARLFGRQVTIEPARTVAPGAVIPVGRGGMVPEMTSDIVQSGEIGLVQNVRRGRAQGRPWARSVFGRLMGRMLGGA
jgi:hypothetical protein